MGRSRALHRHARVPRARAPAAAHADPHAAGQTPQQVPPQQQQQQQSTAALSLDDPSTWTQFMRSTSNSEALFRAAVEERFSALFVTVPTEEQSQNYQRRLEYIVQQAVLLRSENSPTERAFLLQECTKQVFTLKAMVALVTKYPSRTNGPQANAGPPVMRAPLPTVPPLPPLPQLGNEFDIDDPQTWANALRRRRYPFQDMVGALQHRFSASLSVTTATGASDFTFARFATMAIRVMELLAARTEAEYQDRLSVCRMGYTLLWRADKRICKITSFLLARHSHPERFRSFLTPASPQAQGQRSPPSRKSSLPSSIPGGYVFRVDDPDTWAIFLEHSLLYFDDFCKALEQRFAFTLLYAVEPEDNAWVFDALNFVSRESIGVFLAESPAEAELVKRLCKIPLKKLIEVDSQLKDMFSQCVALPFGATQERPQPAQATPPGGRLPSQQQQQAQQHHQNGPASASATPSERSAGAGAGCDVSRSWPTASVGRNPFENLGKYKRGFYPEGYDKNLKLWDRLCDYVFLGGDADEWFEDNGFADEEATG